MSIGKAIMAGIMGDKATQEREIDKISLDTAVRTAIFCKSCGHVLDTRKNAVYLESTADGAPISILCKPCARRILGNISAKKKPGDTWQVKIVLWSVSYVDCPEVFLAAKERKRRKSHACCSPVPVLP